MHRSPAGASITRPSQGRACTLSSTGRTISATAGRLGSSDTLRTRDARTRATPSIWAAAAANEASSVLKSPAALPPAVRR